MEISPAILYTLTTLVLSGCQNPQKQTIAKIPDCPGCAPAYPELIIMKAQPLASSSAALALCRPDPPGRGRVDQLLGALTVVVQTYDNSGFLGPTFTMKDAVEYAKKMLAYGEEPSAQPQPQPTLQITKKEP